MKNEFLTYQQFNDIGLAEATAQKLTESGITNTIEDGSKYFDVSFANNSFGANINLKVRASDFTKADKALEELYKKDLDEVDKDYYLFSFSDAELAEIISRPDEWGHLDYQLAQKILKERGKGIDDSEIELLKFRRFNELAEPESTNDIWIVLGYVASLTGGIFGILGGFIGILAGWSLAYWKKTLPDGQKVYAYNDQARRHGKVMIILSVVTSILLFILRIRFLIG